MLDFSAPLPGALSRVLVAGVTGAGKSTLAARIGDILELPYTEIDSLHHGPEWTPRAEFDAEVAALAATDRWVTEWQYESVRPLLASRTDLLVWLDLPRRISRTRLVRRTVLRRIRRTELWNGNVEPPLHTFFTNPQINILRWEMKSHGKFSTMIPDLVDARPALPIVRLRSQSDVRSWLDRLGSTR